ncbi:hypothetical protein IFM89_027198, partial [Coptis chinensis]
SHTNCPSCRAPIVSSPVLPASTAVVGNSGVREEAQVENSASDGGVGSELNREGGVSDLSLGVQGGKFTSVEEEDEGSSIAPVERGKKLNSSPSLFRLIGSSSKGKLLPKSPVSMKRSFSSGNKLISSRHSRNRSSFIPL